MSDAGINVEHGARCLGCASHKLACSIIELVEDTAVRPVFGTCSPLAQNCRFGDSVKACLGHCRAADSVNTASEMCQTLSPNLTMCSVAGKESDCMRGGLMCTEGQS